MPALLKAHKTLKSRGVTTSVRRLPCHTLPYVTFFGPSMTTTSLSQIWKLWRAFGNLKWDAHLGFCKSNLGLCIQFCIIPTQRVKNRHFCSIPYGLIIKPHIYWVPALSLTLSYVLSLYLFDPAVSSLRGTSFILQPYQCGTKAQKVTQAAGNQTQQ